MNDFVNDSNKSDSVILLNEMEVQYGGIVAANYGTLSFADVAFLNNTARQVRQIYSII
jgi:hypothetical protein